MTDVIKTADREGVRIITIDNAPVNAISAAVRTGLLKATADAIADPKVKAIVVTGAGRAFVAGADIREFGKPPAQGVPTLRDNIAALEASPKTVVAAINGAAAGGGLEIALGCHYRVAHPKAPLGLPEVNLGTIPGATGTQRLPRAVGKAKAMDLCLTARMMDATEAERAGLVSRIVPAATLREEALAAATKIAAYSLPVVMMIKESINRAFESGLGDGLLFERRVFHASFGLEDQKEGMTAFAEKRPPLFRHR